MGDELALSIIVEQQRILNAFSDVDRGYEPYSYDLYLSDVRTITRWDDSGHWPSPSMPKPKDFACAGLDNILHGNLLFGPIGIAFNKHTKSAFVIEASNAVFKSKAEMDEFIRQTRPLIYYTQMNICNKFDPDTFMPITDMSKTTYLCRHFSSFGKLPKWKYYLQYLGKFKLPRPLRFHLYRILTTK